MLVQHSWHGSINNICSAANYSSEESVKCVSKQHVDDVFKTTKSFLLSLNSEQILSHYHCYYYRYLYDCNIQRLSQKQRWSLPRGRSQFKLQTRDYWEHKTDEKEPLRKQQLIGKMGGDIRLLERTIVYFLFFWDIMKIKDCKDDSEWEQDRVGVYGILSQAWVRMKETLHFIKQVIRNGRAINDSSGLWRTEGLVTGRVDIVYEGFENRDVT